MHFNSIFLFERFDAAANTLFVNFRDRFYPCQQQVFRTMFQFHNSIIWLYSQNTPWWVPQRVVRFCCVPSDPNCNAGCCCAPAEISLRICLWQQGAQTMSFAPVFIPAAIASSVAVSQAWSAISTSIASSGNPDILPNANPNLQARNAARWHWFSQPIFPHFHTCN